MSAIDTYAISTGLPSLKGTQTIEFYKPLLEIKMPHNQFV